MNAEDGEAMSESEEAQAMNALAIVAVFDSVFDRTVHGELIKDAVQAGVSGVHSLMVGGVDPSEALMLVAATVGRWADDPDYAQVARHCLRHMERESGVPCPIRYRQPEDAVERPEPPPAEEVVRG